MGRGGRGPVGGSMWQQTAAGPGSGPPTTATAAALSGMANSMQGGPPPSMPPQQQQMPSGYPPHHVVGGPPPPQHYVHRGAVPGGSPPPSYGMHPSQQISPMMHGGQVPPGAQMRYMAGPPPGGRSGYGLPVGMHSQQTPSQYQGGGRSWAPPPQMGQGGAASAGGGRVAPSPSPRAAKPLIITDRHGNVIDLGNKQPSAAPETATTAAEAPQAEEKSPAAPANLEPKMSSLQIAAKAEAGNALRKAAEEAIAAGSAKKAREEAARKQKALEEEEARLAEEARSQEEAARLEKERQEEAIRVEKEAREREERERLEREEAQARKEAEERARREFLERERKEAEEKAARARAEEEARAALLAAKEAEAAAAAKAAAAAAAAAAEAARPSVPAPVSGGFRPGGAKGGFRPGGARAGLRPGSAGSAGGAAPTLTSASAPTSAMGNTTPARAEGSQCKPIIYSKQILLGFRDSDYCVRRPEDLLDMTVKAGGGGGGRGGDRRHGSARGNGGYDQQGHGGGGGDQWSRGGQLPQPQGGHRGYDDRGRSAGGGGGEQWDRGRAPPPRQQGQGDYRGQNGRRGNRNNNNNDLPFPDDNFEPIVKTKNAWKPSKDNSAMAKTEKQIKALLNKITKEKFDKLSTQMCDMPILSYEMLTLVIKLVYEKAIGEPYLSDMYANLCYRLSEKVKNSTFIKIIESDEDPMAEPGAEVNYDEAGSSSVSYRWSNDVSTSNAEVVGPFDNDEMCVEAAFTDQAPIPRADELTLHRLLIKRGMFIKIMHSHTDSKYYCEFFPVSSADECGQQLSLDIFTSEIEARNHATKMNTFKRSLLNKCEDEFNKQDIYTEWKLEKKEYEKKKATMTEAERRELEADMEFRRMKIKKQMLGNIKFIGELYKLGMLKIKIMRFCIHSLLKLEEFEGGLRSQTGEDGQMDEEDHEALCNLFRTIGKTIDTPKAQPYMRIYFGKIELLSEDKMLSSRSRFAYKDLIDMRAMAWKVRREVETAKTLDEIRKDAEREERKQQQQSQGGGNYGQRGGRDRGGYDGNRGGGRGFDSHKSNRGDNRGYDSRGPPP